MRVRNGLSNLSSNIGRNNYSLPQEYKKGKVYSVILNNEGIPKEIWDKIGGWDGRGAILYGDYEEDHEVLLNEMNGNFLNSLPVAYPLFPNNKLFPLPGELVYIITLPSIPSSISDKTEETYYVSVINTWNTPHYNGMFYENKEEYLNQSFRENSSVKGVLYYEGDNIFEGRFGNSIRLGGTNRSGENSLNFWSSNSKELDNNPIILISNSHNNQTNSGFYSEDINKDGSSIYLTSKQNIPLDVGDVKLSNIMNPSSLNTYSDPQILMNSDRIVILTKKDEIFLIGKEGIELYSPKDIYIQSDKTGITLQENKIYFGPSDNSQTTQPLILGSDLKVFLSSLISALGEFSVSLSEAVSSPEGTPLTDIVQAAGKLQIVLEDHSNKLADINYLVSKKVYTI